MASTPARCRSRLDPIPRAPTRRLSLLVQCDSRVEGTAPRPNLVADGPRTRLTSSSSCAGSALRVRWGAELVEDLVDGGSAGRWARAGRGRSHSICAARVDVIERSDAYLSMLRRTGAPLKARTHQDRPAADRTTGRHATTASMTSRCRVPSGSQSRQARRQQLLLLAITRGEVVRHPESS